MTNLYFISIFDSIIGVCVLGVICGLAAALAWIVCVVLNSDIDNEDLSYHDEQRLKTNNTVIKIAKPFVYAGIVCLVIATFLPSTKQGYMIYGVSNTIEYIKSNEKATELPDKVIMALDKWLEIEINDEKGGNDERETTQVQD